MYWSACISTCASRSAARRVRGIWITLVIAASPLIATATSRLLAPARLTARRIGLADRFGIDDGLLVDRVLGGGLGRIGLDPVLPARHRELDELYRRGGYVKSQERAILTLEEEHFLFPFQ